jgi:hypothetical protein
MVDPIGRPRRHSHPPTPHAAPADKPICATAQEPQALNRLGFHFLLCPSVDVGSISPTEPQLARLATRAQLRSQAGLRRKQQNAAMRQRHRV